MKGSFLNPPSLQIGCVALLLVCAAAQALAAPSYGLIFRNDTADVERFLRTGYARAQDDQLTVSVGARLEGLGRQGAWDAAVDLHVFTQRREGHRVDLGLFKVGRIWNRGSWRLHAAVGVAAVGNLGGEALQNGYHELSGNVVLDLNYPEASTLDPLLEGAGAWMLWKAGRGAVEVQGSALACAAFQRERASLALSQVLWKQLQFEAAAGWVWHHGLSAPLESGFQSGPCYGVLAAWPLPKLGRQGSSLEICAFFLANGARQDQSLPGLALRFGPEGKRQSHLERVAWGP